jgi:hypothetical protein
MKIHSKLFFSYLLCAAIGLSSGSNSRSLTASASGELPDPEQTGKDFGDYKNWTRVNAKPLKMEANISIQCAAPLPARNNSPHQDKFIVVYVNDLGQSALLTQQNPQFPQGSAIVKEKLALENQQQPELLTAMVKREKGFNPGGNDWEFFVLSGDAKSVQAQGKLDNCLACHTANRGNDFVFRNYLPKDVMMKLKD